MNNPIAIVGMACRYPDANTVDELFENSLAQRRSFRQIPSVRLPAEYFDDTGQDADRAYARQAAVLKGFEFDRRWFKVSRQSFEVTDLAHWLALTVARETIEDIRFRSRGDHPHHDAVRVVVADTLTSEFSRASLMRLRWPYVRRLVAQHLRQDNPGIEEGDLARRLRELEVSYKRPFPVPNEDFLAGGLANTIAGRICNHFDFKGGGYTVDGACASSLLAVSDACSALVAGDADMVLAGGVDLSLDPFELVGFSRSEALAKTEMFVYDERSEGFWPGEGCGFVALMRYADAVEQCERIHAVIHGWGISSDGRGGLTRPESDGQQLALRRCYARAGYGIGSVGYFEGHGTGTPVGDTAELDALLAARRGSGGQVRPAVISSVKANIGHTKAAAGLAGLVRAAKCVAEHVLPPTTGCGRPHRLLAEQAGSLAVSAAAQEWEAGGIPRRAGISAMGFGGINTHLTIAAAPPPRRRPAPWPYRGQLRLLGTAQDAELFLFAASSRGDLSWTVGHIARMAQECSRAELTDLAVELARRATRDMLKTWKAAVVASTPAELKQRLDRLQAVLETADEDVLQLAVTDSVFLSGGDRKGAVGLVFPGHGAPAPVTGGLHARCFDEVRQAYERSDLPSFADRSDTDFAHSAVITAAIAGLAMLRRVGIVGTVAVGHSLGELAALHWAGCFDENSLRTIAKDRGLAITKDERTRGAMAAIAAGQDETALLIGDQDDVVVANINAPRQTIVAGAPDAVEALVGRARRQGTAATPLRVRRAFHSPAMAAAAVSLAGALDAAVFAAPERMVISTVTGNELAAGADLVAHLRDQLVKPVQFRAAISQAASGVDLFVEVGPGEVLGDLVRRSLATPVVSLDVGGDSVAPYLRAVGASFVLGCAPAIRRLFEDRFARSFDWNWKPRFLEAPCEMFAADSAANDAADGPAYGGPEPGPEPGTAGRREPDDEASAERPAGGADQVRQVLAEHTGLPAWTFEDSSRMSADLHLNSITVAEIIIRLTTARGVPAPVDSTEYANASVGEIATALDHLAEIGAEGRDSPTAATPGVAGWLRDFAVVRIPARPLVAEDQRPPGTWEGFGASTPDAGHLVERLNAEPEGNGVLVWIEADPGAAQRASLLTAAHRCLERQREVAGPLRFVVVQHGWGAGGFARSFFLEQTSIDVLVVNLPSRPGAGAADWVVREIASRTAGFREVFIDASGGREETRWQPLEPAPATGHLLGPDDLVLVTGGGKGITAECGFQLARRTGCALLVLGRSVPEGAPELAGNLQRFRAAGVRASYQVADVTDAPVVAAAIAAGTAELGLHVTGILHGAGVNRPQTVASLAAGELESTLAPKVTGLQNVLAAVDPARLKLLSTFGSIIGRMGLAGEADYALSNEWLSHRTEAFQRRHPHCRCRAIEWSAWSGTGMGQRLGRIDALERRGISPISVDEGVAEFLRLVQTPGLPTSLVVSGRFGEPRTFNYDRPAPAGLRFLDSVLVNYPGIELVAQCELSRVSDGYVDDHVLEGQHLFPAVMALEALTEATGALLGRDARTLRLQFRDLAFRSAIVIPSAGDASISLRVLALAGRDGEVQLAIRCSSTEFQVNHVEARCRVRDDDGFRTEVPELPGWPGEDLAAFDPGRSLYGNVLFQRGRFRRIERYQMIEARRCSSRLSGDGATPWFAPDLPQAVLLGDPGARDAALHAIQACIPHKIVVPVFVEQIDAGALDPSNTHYMLATEVADRGDELVYDLTIFDPGGRLVERWRNLALRVVGQPAALRLDSPSLMAPYFERRVAAASPGAHLRVTLEGATGPRSRQRHPDTSYRPDGKPDPSGNHRFRSAAYTGEWRLAVTADVPAGCDLEAVASRELRWWERLLGEEGLKLASVTGELAGEHLDVSATRVWTVREALKKAGLPTGTPVVVDPRSQADWIVFRAGHSIVYSSLITADGSHPAMCVAAALGCG